MIGVGEQSSALFADPYFDALGVRHVRYVVGWDALRTPWSRAEVDQWMAAAHAANVDVLLAFNVSRDATRHDVVPTVAQYRRAFLGFRKRYPFVHEFISWNEGNHHSQPTAKRPWLAAKYFATAQIACPRCTIVAADLLDDETVPRLGAGLPAPLLGQAADLGHPQLHRREPLPHERHARDAARHPRPGAAVVHGDRRPRLAPRRPAARTRARRTPPRRRAGCSSSRT